MRALPSSSSYTIFLPCSLRILSARTRMRTSIFMCTCLSLYVLYTCVLDSQASPPYLCIERETKKEAEKRQSLKECTGT